MNPLIEKYIETLRPHLGLLGLEDVECLFEGGRLLLTPVPLHLLPVRMEVAACAPGQRYFKANTLVGVSHGKLPEGVVKPPARLVALTDLLLRLATPELVKGLGPPRIRDARLWNLDLTMLVAKGLKPAAILNVENRADLLEKVFSRVPAAAASTYPYVRNSLDQIKWIKGGEVPKGHVAYRLVYCAQEMRVAQLLQMLDWELYEPRSHAKDQQARIGVILGYPECCAKAYEREASDETEMEDVRWVRAYVKAAEKGWEAAAEEAARQTEGAVEPELRRFSPWTNFLAARMSHMSFFEHLPCTPWCQATEEHVRKVASNLYGPGCDAWLLSLLSISFFCWSDGTIVPFRCGTAVGQQMEIRDVGTAWTHGIVDRFMRRLSDGTGRLPADPGDIKALRRKNDQWEIRAKRRWLPLGTGKEAPMVLVYES